MNSNHGDDDIVKPSTNAAFVVKFQPVYDCTERHFLQELRTLQWMQVNEPGVAPHLHSAWVVAGEERGCVVMERIQGVTLREWRRNHQLRQDHVSVLLSSVQQMHRAGVVHGDLHQDNIMVESLETSDSIIFPDSSVRFRIIDFGEAELLPGDAAGCKMPESDITMLLEDLNVEQ